MTLSEGTEHAVCRRCDRLSTELTVARGQVAFYRHAARRAELHLRLRTAALIRLIERAKHLSKQ